MAKQALDLVLLHFPILALKAAEEEGEEEEEGEDKSITKPSPFPSPG